MNCVFIKRAVFIFIESSPFFYVVKAACDLKLDITDICRGKTFFGLYKPV